MIKIILIIVCLLSLACIGDTFFRPSRWLATKEDYDLWKLTEHCKKAGVLLDNNNISRCKEVVNEINHSKYFKAINVTRYSETFERFLTIHKAIYHNIDVKVFFIDPSIINSYYKTFKEGIDENYGIAVKDTGECVVMSFFKDKKSFGKIYFFKL